MKKARNDIWFPAKKYGYGWGLPVAWQGWLVLLAYMLLVGLTAFTLTDSSGEVLALIIINIILSIILFLFCIKKGEKPAWRWGDND